MQPISMLLPELKVSDVRPKLKNQRQYLISLFEEQLNKDRGDRKPLTSAFIAVKMSHLSILDLYAFLGICEKGDIFAKVWWGALKDRPVAYKPKWK